MFTFAFIRANEFEDTLRLAEYHLGDEHDLMHKACGWMLREVGKRDVHVLRDFLKAHASVMPRTELRYAIEKLEEDERQYWLTLRRESDV
jgi:3-methyladenine DNA glycosylase AlkD